MKAIYNAVKIIVVGAITFFASLFVALFIAGAF